MNEKRPDGGRTVRQVREALDFAEKILSTISEPLLVLDSGLRIVSANRSFYREFLVTPAETEGKLIYEVGNGQWGIPRLRELLETILPKNTTIESYEVDHEFPNLGRRIMLLNARRIHNGGEKTQRILLAIEDVTERKRIEREMTSSELRYRRLFETAQDGILILNAGTGEINDVNPFLLNMLRYSRRDLLGKQLWEIGFFKDEKASRQALQQLQTNGYARYENLPLRTSDGQPIQVEFVSNRYTVNGDNVIQCNIRDITERKKTEQMRDEFVGVLSHELKNGLAVIVGALSTAIDERVSEQQSRELLGDAVEHAEAMGDMVDNLLELARQQSDRLVLQASPVDVGEVTQRVMKRLERKSPIHRLVDHVPPELPLALADPIRTQRILYNLIDNAIKYSTNGGEVTVSARHDGEYLIVAVTDQGQGISRADQARLFGSFERLEQTTTGIVQGTGLGLRVCLILAQAHGGRIWVESETGKGSTFFFTLPVSGNSS